MSKSVSAGLDFGLACTPALYVTQKRRCSCSMRTRLMALYKCYMPLPPAFAFIVTSSSYLYPHFAFVLTLYYFAVFLNFSTIMYLLVRWFSIFNARCSYCLRALDNIVTSENRASPLTTYAARPTTVAT